MLMLEEEKLTIWVNLNGISLFVTSEAKDKIFKYHQNMQFYEFTNITCYIKTQ